MKTFRVLGVALFGMIGMAIMGVSHAVTMPQAPNCSGSDKGMGCWFKTLYANYPIKFQCYTTKKEGMTTIMISDPNHMKVVVGKKEIANGKTFNIATDFHSHREPKRKSSSGEYFSKESPIFDVYARDPQYKYDENPYTATGTVTFNGVDSSNSACWPI